MKLKRITEWIDKVLDVKAFSDVSNNGVQIARTGDDVKKVAFGVDASVAFIEAAAAAGAQLAVVHHGISWGGGIARIVDGVYNVVAAAMRHNVALYGVHLPLDANRAYGNNYELARFLGLKNLKPAFVYHGETIGLIGRATRATAAALDGVASGDLVGVCSGGAGEFAEEAQRLGCRVYVTGEANWGEVVAAANCGMRMVCLGHYETEVWGVRAVAKAMASALGVKAVDLTEVLK